MSVITKKDLEEVLSSLNEAIDGLELDDPSKDALTIRRDRIQEALNSIPSDSTDNAPVNFSEENEQDIAESWKLMAGLKNVAKEQEQIQKIDSVMKSIGDVVSGYADMKIANSQINEAKAAIDNIAPPTGVRNFNRSALLEDQIRETRQSATPQALANRTAGMASDIEQNYYKDLNNAAIASGGQAGAYGANSQVAARNRFRNALELQKLRAQLQDQSQRNLNYLAGQDIAQNRAIDVNNRARAEWDYRRFKDESTAAAELMRAGNINRVNARNRLINQTRSLSPLLANVDLTSLRRDRQTPHPSRIGYNVGSSGFGSTMTVNPYQIQTREPLYDINNFDIFRMNENLNKYM